MTYDSLSGTIDHFDNSQNGGQSSGTSFVATPEGYGLRFSQSSESRLVYSYASGFPRSGTVEIKLKVDGGYRYQDGLLDEDSSAQIFGTDIPGGDVTWPGSTWLQVDDTGWIRYRLAGEKFAAGWGEAYTITMDDSAFRFGQWHTISISYGDQGMALALDGEVIGTKPTNTQTLAGGGTHAQSLGQPTIGEGEPSFWSNNRWEGGFEGVVEAVRYTGAQMSFEMAGGTNAAPVVHDKIFDSLTTTTGKARNLKFKPFFTDSDGDSLTFSATGLPDGLTIDAVSGKVSGRITASPKTFDVTISATDASGGTASHNFDWHVTESYGNAKSIDWTTYQAHANHDLYRYFLSLSLVTHNQVHRDSYKATEYARVLDVLNGTGVDGHKVWQNSGNKIFLKYKNVYTSFNGFSDDFAPILNAIKTAYDKSQAKGSKAGKFEYDGYSVDLKSFDTTLFKVSDFFAPRGAFDASGYKYDSVPALALVHFLRNLASDERNLDYVDLIRNADKFTRLEDKKNEFHKLDVAELGISGNRNNIKWVSKNGGHHEFIYKADGFDLVDDVVNAGSYNLYPGNLVSGKNHMKLDVFPWIAFGNLFGDSTTVSDRAYDGVKSTLGKWLPIIRENGTAKDNSFDYKPEHRMIFTGFNGHDTFYSGPQHDHFFGGRGSDTVSYVNSTSGVTVNLRLGKGYDGYAGHDDNSEILNSIENVVGSPKGDILVGSKVANKLSGNRGGDWLIGEQGKDTLRGNDGKDHLEGGFGQDILFGGTKADTFVYTAYADSKAGAKQAGTDRIKDFKRSEGDEIDLVKVDANRSAKGNQAFAFIGKSEFSGTAGELRIKKIAAGLLVQGDINGDGKVDFQIAVEGVSTLSGSDFLL